MPVRMNSSKYFLSLRIALAFCIQIPIAHSQSNFTENYGGTGTVIDIVRTRDNNVALLVSCGTNVLKVDGAGNVLWKATYVSATPYSYLMSIIELQDSSIVAFACDYDSYNYSVEMVKYSNQGMLDWVKVVPFGYNTFSDAAATTDGGFLMGGGTELIKCNADGEIVWQKALTGNFAIRKIIQVMSGKLLLYGMMLNGLTNDIGFVKTDSLGGVLWAKSFGGSDAEWPTSITETEDLGYTMSGSTFSLGTSYSQPFLVHVNSSGVLQWFKAYDTNNGASIYGVKELKRGDLVIIGSTFYDDARNVQILFFKTDSSGKILWARTTGENGFTNGTCLEIANDQSVFMSGNNYGPFLSKLDTAGLGFCSFDTITLHEYSPSWTIAGRTITSSFVPLATDSTIDVSVTFTSGGGYLMCHDLTGINQAEDENKNMDIDLFPNPLQAISAVEYTLTQPSQAVLQLIDPSGRILRTFFNEKRNTGKQKEQVSLDGIPAGIYFLQLTTNEKTAAVKIVKQ